MAYYEQPYDRSRSTARLSDLARLRAGALAQGELDAGMASANAVGQSIAAVGGTLADLARIKAEQPERDRIAADRRTASNRAEVVRLAAQAENPDEAARMLRGEGLVAEAEHIEDRADRKKDRERSLKNEGLNALYSKFDRASTLAGKGAVLVGEAKRDPSLWPEIRPLVADLAGQVAPQLAEFIPQDNNPDALDALLASATQMAENHAKAAAALKAIDVGLSNTKKLAEAQKGVAQLLSSAKSPEEWDGMTKGLGSLGVPEALVSSFGAFSPESVKRAMAIAGGDKGAEGFNLAPGHSRYDASGRLLVTAPVRPEPGSGGGPKDDPALPAGVKQYLASLLTKHRGDFQAAEAEWNQGFREQQAKHPNLDPTKARRYLQATFGVPGASLLPEDEFGAPTLSGFRAAGFEEPPAGGSLADLARPASPLGTAAPGAAPAAAAPRGQVARPSDIQPPAPQPVTPQTPSGGQPMNAPPPPEVEMALIDARPGEYDLSDGSVWRKLEDGRLLRVR